jgi:hypothetical protein
MDYKSNFKWAAGSALAYGPVRAGIEMFATYGSNSDLTKFAQILFRPEIAAGVALCAVLCVVTNLVVDYADRSFEKE